MCLPAIQSCFRMDCCYMGPAPELINILIENNAPSLPGRQEALSHMLSAQGSLGHMDSKLEVSLQDVHLDPPGLQLLHFCFIGCLEETKHFDDLPQDVTQVSPFCGIPEQSQLRDCVSSVTHSPPPPQLNKHTTCRSLSFSASRIWPASSRASMDLILSRSFAFSELASCSFPFTLSNSSSLLFTSASELSSLACSSVGEKGDKHSRAGANKPGHSPPCSAHAGS